MTSIEKKQLLIREILDLSDDKVLDDLLQLFSKSNSKEFYSKELSESIKRGLTDLSENNVRPHNVVMEKFKEKYGL